jgi:hypothetical protein
LVLGISDSFLGQDQVSAKCSQLQVQTDTAASDIDLMVISDELAYADLFGALEKAGSAIGRTVNPTILTRKDLAKKVKAKESFITRVLAQPKIWIVGDDSALTA